MGGVPQVPGFGTWVLPRLAHWILAWPRCRDYRWVSVILQPAENASLTNSSGRRPYRQLSCFQLVAHSCANLCTVFTRRFLSFQHLTDSSCKIPGVGVITVNHRTGSQVRNGFSAVRPNALQYPPISQAFRCNGVSGIVCSRRLFVEVLPMKPAKSSARRGKQNVTLRTIAEHLGLTPGTVSAALNNSAAAQSIPDHTKQRIIEAARKLNYRPNFFARSLRLQRTYTIGVIAEEIGDAYGSTIISGIEQYLRQNNYFFLTVIHRHDKKLLQTYSHMLQARGVEGFITVDTSITEVPGLPTVAVAGHERVQGVTNIILDHRRAAELALQHLRDLGHEDIAVVKGQKESSDSEARWTAILEVAEELGIRIRPELTIELQGQDSTPAIGYPVGKELLARNKPFTAVFSYNDISAIGIIWAFRESGLRVPQDISVVGFDDVPGAAYANPGLSTVRQPLERMGQIAAQTLIDRIEGRAGYLAEIAIEPEFIVRKSTGPAAGVTAAAPAPLAAQPAMAK
jgi:DNA-binding LacI/PurR family transcriptional regulator